MGGGSLRTLGCVRSTSETASSGGNPRDSSMPGGMFETEEKMGSRVGDGGVVERNGAGDGEDNWVLLLEVLSGKGYSNRVEFVAYGVPTNSDGEWNPSAGGIEKLGCTWTADGRRNRSEISYGFRSGMAVSSLMQ